MWPRKISPEYDRLRAVDSDTQSLTDGEVEKQYIAGPATFKSRTMIVRIKDFAMAVTAILCLWIALVTAWRVTLHPTRPQGGGVKYEKQTLTCGNTTAEAERLGCAFDLLSHNWTPAPCLDRETEAEFREFVTSPDRMYASFPYYLDHEGRDKIADERALSLRADGATDPDQFVVTTQEEHLAHCRFLIRRIHRAAKGKVHLDNIVGKFGHTTHCIQELSTPNAKALDTLEAGYYVGFTTCTVDIAV